MNGQSVLLLGGTGFLGTALARRLARENWDVCVVGRRAFNPVLPGVISRQASLDDETMLRDLLPRYRTVGAFGVHDHAGEFGVFARA